MVKIMENPIKMDDLGENPLFSETSICHTCILKVDRFNGFQLDKKQVCRANWAAKKQQKNLLLSIILAV